MYCSPDSVREGFQLQTTESSAGGSSRFQQKEGSGLAVVESLVVRGWKEEFLVALGWEKGMSFGMFKAHQRGVGMLKSVLLPISKC